jgi:hypothetical protein
MGGLQTFAARCIKVSYARKAAFCKVKRNGSFGAGNSIVFCR